jgi:hypothetical protein
MGSTGHIVLSAYDIVGLDRDLEDLVSPTGHPIWTGYASPMERSAKLSVIQQFESAIDPLIDFVKRAPAGAIAFKPDLSGAWSIRDHAVHFLDADTFAWGRLRLTVTQPGAEVFVWNEEAWQERGRYDTADALACLETARSLRRIAAAMAKALVDSDWESYYVRHAQRGRMTLADVLKLYTDHAAFHMSYFRRNLEAFGAAAAK